MVLSYQWFLCYSTIKMASEEEIILYESLIFVSDDEEDDEIVDTLLINQVINR
jgi:hypothetical protein